MKLTPRACWVFTADRLPDHHCRGRAYTEWHHERERGDVERYLMRGHLHGPERPHQQRRGPERAELQLVVQADGRADTEQTKQWPAVPDLAADWEKKRAKRSPGDDQETGRQKPARHARGHAGPHRTEPRKPQVAEDQEPIEKHVRDVRECHGDDQRSREVVGLQALAKHDEHEERERARHEGQYVVAGDGNDVGRLVQQREQRRRGDEQQRGDDPEHDRKDEAALHAEGDGGLIAGADALRDHRIEGHENAHAKDGDREEVQRAQRHGGEIRRSDAADHRGVYDPHGHHPDLDRRHGDGQAQNGARGFAKGAH
jgi:hypothetical protein